MGPSTTLTILLSSLLDSPAPTHGMVHLPRVNNYPLVYPLPQTANNSALRGFFYFPSFQSFISQIEERDRDPCNPSPCGPFSQCQDDLTRRVAACTCLPNYIGVPPNCRPECSINPDCPSNLACVREKCIDPCPGSCGPNAECQVVNHNPICRCPPGLFGDPYVECKPECTINFECPVDKACVRQKCVDPCPGVCGSHSSCSVNNHAPTCRCDPGYTGDPFTACYRITTPITTPRPVTEIIDPCNPSPCGSNAVCTQRGSAGSCRCIPDYFGDPYVACRPECVINSDCPASKQCRNLHCIDPCPGLCGNNANCKVPNHIPVCVCNQGYIGDPFTACRLPIRTPVFSS